MSARSELADAVENLKRELAISARIDATKAVRCVSRAGVSAREALKNVSAVINRRTW